MSEKMGHLLKIEFCPNCDTGWEPLTPVSDLPPPVFCHICCKLSRYVLFFDMGERRE